MALNTSNEVMFKEENGMRSADIPKNLVVVTDGECTPFCNETEHVTPEARKLKDRNIRIIAVLSKI